MRLSWTIKRLQNVFLLIARLKEFRIKWNMTSNKSLTINECKESFKTRHGYIKFCTPRVATLLQFLQYHYHHFHYLILAPSSNLLTTEGTYILVSSTNINCVCRICILSYLLRLIKAISLDIVLFICRFSLSCTLNWFWFCHIIHIL